jgi:RNA polymerase sigma-70 factor (ECF subfamily)
VDPTLAPATYPPGERDAAAGAGPTDAELLARMAAGDEQALGMFYDRWEQLVRAVVARRVVDPMTAEDIVETVFWQAWRQAARFDASRGSASTWLLTIARSRTMDRLRSMARDRATASLDDVADGSATPSDDPDALLAPADDPHAAAELAERSVRVRHAVMTLPADQREALELAYFAGLSQSEIAERTGTPLGTVKTRTRLALRKLRDALGALREDDR